MSGIFGIISKTGQPIKSSWTASMLGNLRHRGPDGAYTWKDEIIVLGHLMMHITPESCYDKQPLDYGHRVITADVRLDNRKELFHLLTVPVSVRNDITDSLLILKAFEKWGNECPKYLVGDFAFAIWDKVQRRLFCAKDHAGVRQLFYYESTHYLVFATEVRAIAKLEFVPFELDENALTLHLLKINREGNNASPTLIKGIQRLLPANWLQWHDNKLITELYWERDPGKKLKFADETEFAAALRELIQQAIDDRIRTDYPIGVTLSGGLDSSSIACLAARCLAKSGKILYSASSVLPLDHSGIEEDERSFIELILAQEKNISPQFVTAEGKGAFDDLDTVFEQLHGMANTFYYMDRAINQSFPSKVRVVLSGFVGDSTVSNSGKMVLSTLFSNLQLKKGFNILKQKQVANQKSYLKTILSEVIAPLLPANLLLPLLNLKNNPNRRKRFTLSDYAVSEQFLAAKSARKLYTKQAKQRLSQMTHFNSIWDTSFLWFNGESTLDSHYGKEYSFPYADKRLIEFLWASPAEYFLYKGIKRGCLRRAMEGVLPNEILWRRNKTSYSPDFSARIIKEVPKLSKTINKELNGNLSFYLSVENIIGKLEEVRPNQNWEDFDRNILNNVVGMHGLLFLKWIKK